MSSAVGDASDKFVSLSSSDDESEYSEREYLSQDESSDEDVRESLSKLQPYQFELEHDGKDYQTDSESDSDDNCDQSIHSAKSQGEEKGVGKRVV